MTSRPDAPAAQDGLDLVEPLVDEALLRMEPTRIACPAVADDRREARTARARSGTDGAAPATQGHRPVARPDQVDRVDGGRSDPGPERAWEILGPHPPAAVADRGEPADRLVDRGDRLRSPSPRRPRSRPRWPRGRARAPRSSTRSPARSSAGSGDVAVRAGSPFAARTTWRRPRPPGRPARARRRSPCGAHDRIRHRIGGRHCGIVASPGGGRRSGSGRLGSDPPGEGGPPSAVLQAR